MGLVLLGCAAVLPGCPSMGVDIAAYSLDGEPLEGVRVAAGVVEDVMGSGAASRGTETSRGGRAALSVPVPPAVTEAPRTLSVRDGAGQWWETGLVPGSWVFSTDPGTQKRITATNEIVLGELIPGLAGTRLGERVANPAVVYFVGETAVYDPSAPMFFVFEVSE